MSIRTAVRTLRREYKNSIYYKKVLYSYLLATCVIFLFFVLLLFLFMNRDYETTLEDMQDYTITQAYNVNQTTLKDIISYCYNMLDNVSMRNILYGDSWTGALSIDATEFINSIRMASSMVNSVYFINFNTGTVLDHTGRTSTANHIDGEIFELLEEMTPGIRPLFCCPRIIDCNVSGVIYRDIPVLTMIFFQNRSGAMVVNLDYQAYYNMLSLGDSEYIDMVMVSSTGKVMSASDPELFGMDYTENQLYRRIQDSPDNRGTFSFQHEDGNRTVKYIKNIGLGITYICSLRNLYIYPGNSVLSTLFRYSAVYLLIGLVLSLLLSWLIYNPLRQLKTYIAAHPASPPEPQEKSNDFDYLSRTYQEILTVNTSLKRVSNAYMKEQRRKLLKALLTDTLGDFSQYSAELEALNADLHERNNLILLLGIDPPASTESEIHMESGLMKYVIQNVTEELLSSTVHVLHIDMESPCVTFLLNFGEPNPEEIVKLLREAQNFVEQHYKHTFSAGIGDITEDLTELSLSCQSAYEAFSQRFVTGNSSIHMADALELTPTLEQIYPFAIGDRLLGAVKSLSLTESSGYVHDFIAAISTYHIEQILCFVLQLVASLQRLELTNYIAVEGDWNYKALEQSTLKTIEEKLTERCANDIEQLAKTREADSGKKELIEEIIRLTEENIYNPDLSVVFLADRVHLSVNYLRNVFKENTGDSLSGYITQKKITLICDLLLNTDMPLSEISDKLGFSTKNYFFTFVKKHTGMTPGDYRKKMGKDRGEA